MWAAIIAGIGVVVAAGSAIYSSNQQKKAIRMQQNAYNLQTQGQQAINDLNEEQRRISVQAALDNNAYEQAVSRMQESRYGLMLQQYGLLNDFYGVLAGVAGQRFALQQEIADWQIATLDWEAGFREQQADLISQKGSLARELFGIETAKLLARERAKKAASGIQIGTGSPVEVLGQFAGERQFASDIMKFETEIDVFDKLFEAAQLRNKKNEVRLGEYGDALDYVNTLAEIGYKQGVNELNIEEATGMLSLAKTQTGLIAGNRSNILLGADIDLRKYNVNKTYGGMLSTGQNSAYNQGASSATVGGYLQAGAAVFNSYNNYYAAQNKYSGNES